MPKVFSGPMVDVPDELWPFFLDNSGEWASMFDNGVSLQLILGRFGLSLVALAGYVWRFRLGNRLVVLLGITHVVFMALSIQQLRWETYLGVLDALALAWLLGLILERLEVSTSIAKRLWPLAAVAFLMAGPIFTVLSPPLATAATSTGATGAVESATQVCDVGDAADALLEVEPTVVLAPLWWGPELVYKTDHGAIGSPMHRNVDGIRFSHDSRREGSPTSCGAKATGGDPMLAHNRVCSTTCRPSCTPTGSK